MYQWKFERCANNHYFPLNVITTYRAFAADETIVTKFVTPENAKSSLGRNTEMDHYLVQVKWYPDQDAIANRPVLGLYLLHDLPDVNPERIPLKEFNNKAIADMQSVLSFIRSTWPDASDSTRMSWEKFFTSHLPVGNGSVTEFIADKRMRYPKPPLHLYLACKNVKCSSMELKIISPAISRRIE